MHVVSDMMEVFTCVVTMIQDAFADVYNNNSCVRVWESGNI